MLDAITIGPFPGTKFHVPVVRRELLLRRRLLDEMDVGGAQVVVLCAPAGFGKSTLIAQWLERRAAGESAAWISLDGDDDSLAGFWNALVTGLEVALGERAAALVRDVRSGWTDVRGVVLIPLVELLAGLPEPLTLVLEDLHVISDETALASFDWLVRRLPSTVRVVLASRRHLDLPALAGLRIHGTAVQIEAGSLRFDLSEVHAFLADNLGLALGRADAERLLDAFDGWPAATYLASLRLRRDPNLDAVFVAGAGSVGRALTAEVLGTYDSRMSGFLLRLSIFERFSVAIAAEVLSVPDAEAMLAELRETNLLLVSLDSEGRWLRLHHLLRDLLREELVRCYPRLARELWLAAGDRFLGRGEWREALGHYLAGHAWQQVGRVLIENAMQFMTQGAWQLLNAYIARIPPDVARADPRLCFVAAYGAMQGGDRAARDAWCNAGRACTHAGELLDGIHDWAMLEGFLRGCQPFRDLGSTIVAGKEVCELLPEDSPYLAVVYWSVGKCSCLHGDWQTARESLEEAARLLHQHPNEAGEMIVLAWQAITLMASGEYQAAEAFVAQATKARVAIAFASDPLSVSALIAAARWSAHEGCPDEALRACEEGLNLTRGWSDNQFFIPCLLIEQARALAMLGRCEEAAASLDDAQRRLEGAVDAGVVPTWLEEVRALLAAGPPMRAPRAAWDRNDLSEREVEVLRMLAGPLSAREIASELFVSSNTLKTHCKAVYRKLDVNSRAAAVTRARELSLVR
jgi:LuxR family maltose regulon positive regulatory protein